VLKIADRRKGLWGLVGGRAKESPRGQARDFANFETHLQQVSGKIGGDCHGCCFSAEPHGFRVRFVSSYLEE